MRKQNIFKKMRVWLHCLFHFHRRGVIHWKNEARTASWTTMVCATCAEAWADKHLNRSPLSEDDMEWGREMMRRHPEWTAY